MLRECLEDGIRHYNNYIVIALVTNTSSSRRVVLDNKEQGIRLFFFPESFNLQISLQETRLLGFLLPSRELAYHIIVKG